MTLLPIVDRELGVAARRAGTYWMRFGTAAGALAIFFVLFLCNRDTVSELGQELFIALSVPTLAFVMFAGVFLTADSLSAEKREGTLGLLFLTDLRGYDVVLGKMAANSMHAFFGLVAVFPIMAIPLLMGGVSAGEFWRSVLGFTSAIYFSLSVGMLISSVSQEGRQAMGRTFAVLLFLTAVLPVAWALLSNFSRVRGYDFLLWPNPVYADFEGFDDQYMTPAGRTQFWISISTTVSLGTICLVASSLALPRAWRKTAAGAPAPATDRLRCAFQGRLRRRPPLGDGKPFYWLARWDQGGGLGLKRIMLLLVPLWALCMGMSVTTGDWDDYFSLALLLTLGLHLAAKIQMASECSRRFYQDRQSGAMELLLVTSLPAPTIAAQAEKALLDKFARTMVVLQVLNVLNLLLLLGDFGHMHMDQDNKLMFAEVLLGGVILLWLDAKAMISLGMWNGLKSKTHARAVLAVLARVMGIPWLTGFLIFFITDAINVSEADMQLIIALWLGLGGVIDLVVITLSQEKLRTSFRSVLAEGYAK